MTFHCEIGNHVTKPRQPRVRIVTKARIRLYPFDGVTNRSGTDRIGSEIEREVDACVSCATAVQNNLLEIPARLKE